MDGMVIEDSTLTVMVDLDLSSEKAFKKACLELVATEGDPVYLDISGAGFIGSALFGQMFVLNANVGENGRRLVIRTSRQLLSIMELLGLPDLVTIEVVEGDG